MQKQLLYPMLPLQNARNSNCSLPSQIHKQYGRRHQILLQNPGQGTAIWRNHHGRHLAHQQMQHPGIQQVNTEKNQKPPCTNLNPTRPHPSGALIRLSSYGKPRLQSQPTPLATRASVVELITLGYIASEAEELHTATNRPDNITGQHVNLTQLPSDIEVHPMTNLSLDYQILLHFEKPITPSTQDHIIKKILERLSSMNIMLGDQIGEPIAILCHGPKTARVWSGMIKLHLKHPEQDGLTLLQGTRVFAITLDNDMPTIAKTAKSYDPLASSSMFLVKINSETIRDLDAQQLIKIVVESSFRRGHDFEITHAHKSRGRDIWLVSDNLPGAAQKNQQKPHPSLR
jgi:hypothetical protein